MKTIHQQLIPFVTNAALLAGAIVTSPASAFTANHLFVGGSDTTNDQATVFEFDSAGTFVRKIVADSATNYVYGITFGPDDRLYCAMMNANKVVRIDPSYAVTPFLDTASGLTGSTCGVEFGPQGRLYVCNRINTGQMMVFNPNGSLAKSHTAPAGLYPSFTTFGPDGHIFLSHTAGGASLIEELDSNLRPVRTIGGGTFTSYPSNLVLGRNGVSYVADYSGNQIQRFDASGAALADLPVTGLHGPYGLAFGPDGNLYVANWNANSNQILVVNPETGATVRAISHPDMESATGMAFAPFRYQVRLKGTVNANGAAQAKLAEATGILSFSPGSGTVMITVAPAAANSIASAFPDTFALVFHGNSAAASTGSTYATQGASVSWESATRSVGSLTLSSKGSRNANGFFVPKTITGAIQLSRPGNVTTATFLTGTLAR